MDVDIERIAEPYYAIKEDSLGELINEVSRFMKAGWKPQGGIAAVNYGSKLLYLQALIRPS